MQQSIAEWLTEIGLERYATAFAEQDIDVTVLRHLTDSDLESIGVSLGHRRKLLAAIAELSVTAIPRPARASPEPKPAETAERRRVTVMFCDLVGSTALSAYMDPEDFREVIATYQKCVSDVVHRLGGFAAKYMGDGVLVYFGFPQAHEDDAERSVRAGLELIDKLGELEIKALQTRVGIATGLVVVGDLIGSGEMQERGIVGETPNLASRLQGIADPNTVVIDEGTRRLLGSFFELKDLGAKDLKGIAGPVRAWAALRASAVQSRFAALHSGNLTALVGRQEEIELLLRRWRRAKAGEGQVALLSGEAGIGKSRLMETLLERVAPDPHSSLRYFCSPQHTDSALYPIGIQIERAAGLTRSDPLRTNLDKLDTHLSECSTSADDAALIAEMLSMSNDGRYPTMKLTPQQRRERTLEALIARIEALADSNPVLITCEDIHWADATTLELISRMVERIARIRVLFIMTFRPEFKAPWIGLAHVTAFVLNRLAQSEVDTMIDHIVGQQLSASTRQHIIGRSDGIPLFVEEMTKAVLEADGQVGVTRAAAAISPSGVDVPASLHASLMARLDRLGPSKEVAQIGAAIGREFSHALLAAVARRPDGELGSALDRLVAAGLLFRQGVPPHANYLFKHALVRDAAYGTLLREPRRALHARIAETLEGQFSAIAGSRPELLAHHCAEAGQVQKAASLWGRAGQQSLERSALVEAAGHLTRALDQIATLPSDAALRREQIKLQVALLNPLMHVKGPAAPETKAAVERARLLIEKAEALGEPPEDPLLLFSVLYGFWGASFNTFNGSVARELAGQLLALAEKQGATVALMIGHRLMGSSLLLMGEIAESRSHLDQALKFYDPDQHRSLASRFGQEIRVSILLFRSLALWLLGYPEAALADADLALGDAREIGHTPTLMTALSNMSPLLCGDYATASARFKDLVALADEQGMLSLKIRGMSLQGYLFSLTGEGVNAVQVLTSAITTWRSTGSTVFIPLALLHLARAHGELGQIDEAWRCIGDATRAVEATSERWFEAGIYHAAGEIALVSPERDAARAKVYFERALAIARKQQAKSLELRAATSMARLWRDEGKRDDARSLLAPVYGWFSEGFGTLALREAKALLDALE
jgi:class 3 adenylate cyclase/predicted ATPase